MSLTPEYTLRIVQYSAHQSDGAGEDESNDFDHVFLKKELLLLIWRNGRHSRSSSVSEKMKNGTKRRGRCDLGKEERECSLVRFYHVLEAPRRLSPFVSRYQDAEHLE